MSETAGNGHNIDVQCIVYCLKFSIVVLLCAWEEKIWRKAIINAIAWTGTNTDAHKHDKLNIRRTYTRACTHTDERLHARRHAHMHGSSSRRRRRVLQATSGSANWLMPAKKDIKEGTRSAL